MSTPSNWIERIPFTETRNYVQRIMENLQVYRARLAPALTIESDLKRGDLERGRPAFRYQCRVAEHAGRTPDAA